MVVAIGVAVGYALVVLVRGIREPVQLLTLTIGGMCTIAGATAAVGVNALPAAACAGAVVVNRAVFPHGMLRVAHSLARPLLVALLVLVGASWRGASFSWPVFALMTVGRAVVLLAVGAVVARVARTAGSGRLSRDLGLGLLPQGELALGLLVAVVAFAPSSTGFLEAVVVAVVVNNLAGARWIANRLAAADPPGASA
jgi:hypothetical protein